MADPTREPRRIAFVDERRGIAFEIEVPGNSPWWGLADGASARIYEPDDHEIAADAEHRRLCAIAAAKAVP